MKKAATTYSKLRTYQRCFNNCARKKEHRCREELSCSVAYPPQKELEGIYDACIGYHVVALENARRSCKCMVFKKKVVRLVDVCSLVSNVFFMNRV
jgi:hypothetical protein